MDISKHPLLGKCHELGLAVEACDASEKLTTVSTKVGEVTRGIETQIEKMHSFEKELHHTKNQLKTPQGKYDNDTQYRQMVDMIEHLLHDAQFTPSEVRDAAVLGCIHFEMRSCYRFRSVPYKVNEALKTIGDFRKEESIK